MKRSKIKFKQDRRWTARRSILDTFHVFICMKAHGLSKIYLHDISEKGFAFLSNFPEAYPVDSKHECLFFVNPGLSLPVQFRVAHSRSVDGERHIVGVELLGPEAQYLKTFSQFVKFLDQLAKVCELYEREPL